MKLVGNGLTAKQQAVVAFVATSIYEHGYPPTLREIGDEFRVCYRAAVGHVGSAAKKGALAVDSMLSRALRLTRATLARPVTLAGGLFFPVVEAPVIGSDVKTPPPFVNGRPSCCDGAKSNKHVFGCADKRWAIWGDNLGNTAISFCPFCGAKLPEVPS